MYHTTSGMLKAVYLSREMLCAPLLTFLSPVPQGQHLAEQQQRAQRGRQQSVGAVKPKTGLASTPGLAASPVCCGKLHATLRGLLALPRPRLHHLKVLHGLSLLSYNPSSSYS